MAMTVPYLASCGCIIRDGKPCKHMRKRDQERKARFDQRRPSASARGYGGKWQTARKDFLQAHPTCVMCGAPANVVDHITPHKGDLKLFWSRTNWQPLCTSCHSIRKQRQERH
jgi:5-methylcytosine-specific restriction endonuclease McrA